MNIVHLITQFVSVAHAHGYRVHSAHGDLGWVLWTQPRHGMSAALAVIRGQVTQWQGVRP